MESKNNTENSAINPEQFNFELFKVVDIKKRNPSDVQEYGFINYNGDKKPLTFRTGEVTLSTYGIPQEHPQYYETDDKRKFIKLPIYPNDSIYSMLNEIDEQFNSPEMKVKTFGKGADKYKYNPIIVTPDPFVAVNKAVEVVQPLYTEMVMVLPVKFIGIVSKNNSNISLQVSCETISML